MVKITGATGFVGQNLMSYFNSHNVAYTPIGRLELECLSADMFNDAQAVIHLAGKAHDTKNTSSKDEYYEINFELTKRIFNAFLVSKAKVFIFLSSVKAVADTVSDILNEDDVPNPMTDYGKSKLLAEQYIQSQELPDGKLFYILRPCMIHGPGNKGNLNLLHKFVSKGIPYPLAAYDNRRSFLSIENLCFVISEILLRNIPSGVYNVSDDDALSSNQLVKLLAESMGRKPKLFYVSPSIIGFIARIGDFLRLPINSEKLKKLTENYVISNRKIKSSLNKDLPVESKTGLLTTARSFLSEQ